MRETREDLRVRMREVIAQRIADNPAGIPEDLARAAQVYAKTWLPNGVLSYEASTFWATYTKLLEEHWEVVKEVLGE
jgi:hypothetical protein